MTRRRSLFITVAALVVLALSGCVRFQADLTVTPDDTVNGTIVVAVVVGDDDASRANAEESAERIEAELLSGVRGAPGVERTVYDEDGYLGSRFTFRDTPIAALEGGGADGSLTLEREGDQFVFRGVLDFTPDDGQVEPGADEDTSNITIAISFPGEVTETNGEISGTTVRWESSFEATLDMHARANANPAGPPGWVWPVGGALLLIVLVVLLLVFRRRSQV